MEPTEIDLKNLEQSVAAQQIDMPLALVFTDMVGSSAAKRAASLGGNSADRDAAFLASVQARHLHLIRECVAAHRGKEIMTIGDAFFLTFEDARSALLCGAEIQMRLKAQPIMTATGRLQLRIGIHVGTPQYFENSWHGTDVDTAARTESVGSPDQIVVTEAAQQAMGSLPGIVFRPLGTFELKGVGAVKLVDADYDAHGARKPRVESLEAIKRRNRLSLARNAAIVLFAVGLAAGGYFLLRPKPKLRITDKDKLVIADFDNKTGDPVFDSTLKEALDIQLEQSPYLQIVSDSELHSDLRYLGQPVDQKITPALAREIGQREGIKAYLSGSVASLGNTYVVSLDAVNCTTGEVFAREQVEAQDKPHVLSAVSTAATNLRVKLGESLASIQKLSSPYSEVTTSSLEAFHAFSLGEDQHEKGRDMPEAEAYYKQAVALDPNFAMAYARLGVVYANSGSNLKGMEYLTKAMDLRERATERERIYIESQMATQQQDLPKALELYRLFTSTYPRDSTAWNNLAIVYENMGEIEKGAEAFEKSYEIAKWDVIGATNAAQTLLMIDRLPEAKHYLEEARVEGGMEDTNDMTADMLYAFEDGSPDWRREIAAAADRQDGFMLDLVAADIDYSLGKIADAHTDTDRAVRRALAAKLNDTAGSFLAIDSIAQAQFGDCGHALAIADKAKSLDQSVETVPGVALTWELCGRRAEGLGAIEKVAHQYPANTLVNTLYVAQVQAAAALSEHHPERVKPLLEDVESYGVASYVPYLEGLALIEQKKPSEAIAALAPAVRWRGADLQMSNNGNNQATLYAVALLLTARAQVDAGDKADAVKTYQQVLTEWKDADPDFKPAQEARRELAALQR